MKKLFLSLALASISASSFAAYKCEFALSKEGSVLSKASVDANSGIATGGHLGDLYTELLKGDFTKKNSKYEEKKLVISGRIVGWDKEQGGQNIVFNIYRTHIGTKGERFVSLEGNEVKLVDMVELRDDSSTSVEFEDYQLNVSCKHAEDVYNFPF